MLRRELETFSAGMYQRLHEETARLHREAEEASQRQVAEAEAHAAEIQREAEATQARAAEALREAEAAQARAAGFVREAEAAQTRAREEIAALRATAADVGARLRGFAELLGQAAAECDQMLARFDAAQAAGGNGFSAAGLAGLTAPTSGVAPAIEAAYVPEQSAPVATTGVITVEVAIAPSVPLPALHTIERILAEISTEPVSLAPDSVGDEVRMIVTTADIPDLVKRLNEAGRFDVGVQEDAGGRVVVLVEARRGEI
jgi:hypothetical protein